MTTERLHEAMDREPRLARALLEVIPDLVFRLKRDGTFLDYLPARGMGTFVPEEAFLGRNLSDVFPSFAHEALEKIALALDSGKEQVFEYELPDGDEIGHFESRFVGCSEDEVIVIVRDVTERRRTAERLRQSEERFRALFEMAGDVILLLDPEGRILELNREAERVYGCSRASVVGRSYFDAFVPEEHRRDVRSEAERALTGGRARGFLLPVVGASPTACRLLSWNVERILDAEGEAAGLVACGHDVTEQQALEESVLDIAKGVSAATGHRFFRDLARRLGEILGADVVTVGALTGEASDRIRTVAVYEDGRLVEDYVYDLRGSPCESVSGRRVCSYPSGVARRFPEDAALSRKGIEGYVGAPLFDSNAMPLGLINVLYKREVPNVRLAESVLRIFATRAAGELEREIAAKELHASEQLNRRIVELMPGGVVQAEADGSIVIANDEAQRVLGLELEPSSGRYVPRDERELIEEDGSPCRAEDTPLAACLATGLAQAPRVLGLRLPPGEVYWGLFTASPLSVTEGAVLTFADITARKKAEEERRRLEARSQHAQKLESLGVLAGGIAHDFNNLLTGILGNLGIALARLPEESEVLEELRRAERAGERAAQLTNQMLAYAGKGTFVVGPLSLNTVVLDLVPLLSSSVSKKASLAYDLDPELPEIEADRSQIEQVVMNLITNASDALGDELGRIFIRTGVSRAERRVFLEVEDEGSGMDEETKARIFDPFFTTKFTGRGLGLAALQGIVRSHRGSIRVESAPGEGTRFTVFLPIAREANRAVERPAAAEGRTGAGTGTVLVVDDEQAVREVAASALQSAGYGVLEARDGMEGVELFERHRETIVGVVLDASMPRMSGEETLRRLQAIWPEVPVLVTSGYSERDAVARFEGAGADGFVQKPFRAHQLVAEVLRIAVAPAQPASGKLRGSQAE